jgi:hypothetical protein
MPLNVPQIANIQDKNLADALQKIVNAHNQLLQGIRVDSSGLSPAPKQVAAVSVLGGTGEVDIAITDNSVVGSGVVLPITYWVEYSTDPNFADPPPYQYPVLGARNFRLKVPPLHLYFRVYSQYFGSHPSTPAVFGGATPTSVNCTTGASPAQQTPQGSGSSPAGRPGTGYGLLARYA